MRSKRGVSDVNTTTMWGPASPRSGNQSGAREVIAQMIYKEKLSFGRGLGAVASLPRLSLMADSR